MTAESRKVLDGYMLTNVVRHGPEQTLLTVSHVVTHKLQVTRNRIHDTAWTTTARGGVGGTNTVDFVRDDFAALDNEQAVVASEEELAKWDTLMALLGREAAHDYVRRLIEEALKEKTDVQD